MTARHGSRKKPGSSSPLASLHRGSILGLLPRGEAETAYRLYESRSVDRVLWDGNGLEGTLLRPACTVRITTARNGAGLTARCTLCEGGTAPCVHAAAVLFRWLDIRATMLRTGPNTVWRSRARQPFLSLNGEAAERLDLTHTTGQDLRAALELQLSLHRAGRASARLVNGLVEIAIDLPSGQRRTVVFSAETLPGALPILQNLDRLELKGSLAELELSEIRLHPTLEASWEELSIRLEPGYRLPDGSFLPLDQVEATALGRWARVGRLLCRRLDPDTLLLPFFRRGRQVLSDRDALSFLTLDHPTLATKPWYLPKGPLARFRKALTPALSRVLVEDAGGRPGVVIKPVFSAGGAVLSWDDTLELLRAGFLRRGDLLLRSPDLGSLEELGFRLDSRQPQIGLRGNRISLLRLIAEADVPVEGNAPGLGCLVAALQPEQAEEVVHPPGLHGILRPYQRAGVSWLWRRHTVGVGALLADDMGLGKTHQVMGLLCLVRRADPAARALIVCPRGVMEHWEDLLSRYVPGMGVHVYHGPDRTLQHLSPETTVVLTTYEIMVRSTDELMSHAWRLAVFDEAQRMKNPRTKASRAAKKIPADHRVALTGTPLENRLVELWSIIDLLVPGYLGPERSFRAAYRDPGQDQLRRLRRRVGILSLRRVKEQVLSDLPPKLEDVRHCRLLPAQEALYRRLHEQQVAPVAEQLLDPDSAVPYVHIFALLTKLKQVCDHPALADEGFARGSPSGKLTVFDELLDEALGSDQQVVVFTQYVKMIEILSRHLSRRGVAHLRLTGSTRDRGHVIRRFNSGQHEPVLLASLLAGGVGIDLTAASVVIHYDRWWNPAKENQATDRVHRIGQRHFVQVYKLVTRGTIEERIDRIIRSKLDLMEKVVAPTENLVLGLSRSELAELLGVRGPRFPLAAGGPS